MSLFVDTSTGTDDAAVSTDLFSISWNDWNLGQGAATTIAGNAGGITTIPAAPVTYSPSVSTGKDTANRLFTLVNNDSSVGLNWGDPILITPLAGGNDPYLGNSIDGNGQTYVDLNVTPNVIHVVYDTSQDGGQGLALFDTDGNAIQTPNCVVLYHELSHAFHNAINQNPFPQTDCPGNTSDEPAAEKDENVLRTELGLCLRDVCNHGGEAGWGKACGGSATPGGPPLQDGSAPSDNGGCFIVTASLGSPYAYEILRLRAIRDRLAGRSPLVGRLIAAVYDEYACFGPGAAKLIAPDPDLRAAVRQMVVGPLFAWYDLAQTLGLGGGVEKVGSALQALSDACDPALSPHVIMLLEQAACGSPMPGLALTQLEGFGDLVDRAKGLPLASWALLQALLWAWRCGARRADAVRAVAEWLAAAPLDSQPEPPFAVIDAQLRQLAQFLEFAPDARLKLGGRLQAAWLQASEALERHGFTRLGEDPE